MLKRPVFPALVVIAVMAPIFIMPRHKELASLPRSAQRPSAASTSQEMPRIRLVANIGQILLSDAFASLPLGMNWVDGSTHGNWRDQYGGYGKVGVAQFDSKAQSSAPKASSRPSETHAALVASRMGFGNVDITLSIKTIKQLRTPRPNRW